MLVKNEITQVCPECKKILISGAQFGGKTKQILDCANPKCLARYIMKISKETKTKITLTKLLSVVLLLLIGFSFGMIVSANIRVAENSYENSN